MTHQLDSDMVAKGKALFEAYKPTPAAMPRKIAVEGPADTGGPVPLRPVVERPTHRTRDRNTRRNESEQHADDPGPADPNPTDGFEPRRVVVTRGSQVKAKKLIWWEPGLVLRAAVNLLAAREGKGKSTVASSWAARETHLEGTVMWIGSEESREHAVVPRLIANGADMDKVVFVDVVTDLGTGSLVFPLDLIAIEKVIVEHGVTMIVLDPAKGLMPAGFSGNDDIAVRQYLEPIASLAARRNVTIIGLAHFGKRTDNDSGKLLLGSVAWSQVARCVLSIAEDPDDGTRVLTNTKANYTALDRSVEFRIIGATVHTDDGPTEWGAVQWIGDTAVDARHLLAGDEADDPDERTATEHWLEDYLTVNGPTPSKVIKNDSAKEKFSEATLKRAKKKLKIEDRSAGFPRTSTWYLPSQLTTWPATPVVPEREPTEPTGADQQKPGEPTGEPTGQILQSAHAHVSEPTGEPTGLVDVCPDCKRAPARTDTGFCDFCTAKKKASS